MNLDKINLQIGHYTDKENLTGCTVFITPDRARIGIDIRGSNTATLNTPAFDSKAAGDSVHGFILTGGSTYGLESAFGLMKYLEEKEIGYKTRGGLIPSITGAVIYDIAVGNGEIRPTKENGYEAAQNAIKNNLEQGNVGVGTGATTGKWTKGTMIKGGFGIGEVKITEDIYVWAFVVTNSVGDIVNKETKEFHSDKGNYVNNISKYGIPEKLSGLLDLNELANTNTTLAVIATNAKLYKTQLQKVSELAHDGMARSIYPVHTMQDGDVIFSLSVEPTIELKAGFLEDTDIIGLAAADALSLAIKNSLLKAETIKGFKALSENI